MRTSGRWWGVIGIVTVASCVAAPERARAGDAPAPAEAPEATRAQAREVIGQLESDQFSQAAERLDADACAALAASPKVAYEVAVAVIRKYADALRKDPPSAVLLLERLASTTAAEDVSPSAIAVRAIARLLGSLTGRLYGRPATLEDVRTPVSALGKLEAKLPPTVPVYDAALAVGWQVATARPTDPDAWGAMLVVAEPHQKERGADEAYAYTVSLAELQRGVLLAATDPATARPLLERSLATFAVRGWVAKQRNGTWPPDAGLFNRGVSAAKSMGSTSKVSYLWDAFIGRDGRIATKVPVSSGWTWSIGESDQDFGRLVRERADGGKIEIRIWGYSIYAEYKSSDGTSTPGENLDGFIKKGMKADRESLDKVTREIRVSSPLSAAFPDTKGYEIKGLGPDGVPTRYRNWFFRSTLIRLYLDVSLTQTGEYSEQDPELLFVLGSMQGSSYFSLR